MHKINTQPISYKKLTKFLQKYFVRFFLVVLVFGLFVFAYLLTFRIFSNDYILEKFIENKGYSSKCLILSNDDRLVFQLNDLYDRYNKKSIVLPLFFNNFPKNFDKINNIELRKKVFINIILPSILKIHNKVIQDRKVLLEINYKMQQIPMTDDDLAFIKKLADEYNVRLVDENFWSYILALENLLPLVDIIPLPLIIAIAAKETGWGTGRFLVEGNALFSQWVWSEHLGIVPNKREKGKTHAVRSFATLSDAVNSFYYNINTHKSYAQFRAVRARYRNEGNAPNVVHLVNTLNNYSQEGSDYTADLVSIMHSNKLEKYSGAINFNKNYNTVCFSVI